LSAEDVAESVLWATDLPAHVNINLIELMPVVQSAGPFRIAKDD
jgi:NADP-dependent 3-hydroxy acid dehydrogenase YdfG